MISYAGVELDQSTPEIEEWVEHNIPSRSLYEEGVHYWSGRGTSSVPVEWEMPTRPVRVNSLFWPRGARRWAVGHFLVTGDKLATIRQRVFANNSYAKKPLVMDDGIGGKVTTDLWMLPARPLVQDNLYLITLVDDRFFWWFEYYTLTVSEGVTTWANVISAISGNVGTITSDSIHADYLKPGPDLGGDYLSVPVLLDRVAFNVGQRVIRRLDGTIHTQGPTNALVALRDNLGRIPEVIAGGTFLFDSHRVPNDLNALVPTATVILFGRSDNNVLSDAGYPQQTNLLDLDLAEFSGVTGYTGSKVFTSTILANFTGGGSPANQAELTSYAERLSTDWYLFALASVDVTLRGIHPWSIEALSGAVEWTLRNDAVSTRVIRPAWDDIQDVLPGTGSAGSAPGDHISNLHVDNLFVDQVYQSYQNVTLGSNQNNYVVDSDVLVINTTAAFQITGFEAPEAGTTRIIKVINEGPDPVSFPHQTTSTATNQIYVQGGGTYSLTAGQVTYFIYDPVRQRWTPSYQQAGTISTSITLATAGTSFTLANSDNRKFYLIDSDAGNVTITIPTVGLDQGWTVWIVKTDAANSVVIDQDGAGLINLVGGTAGSFTMTTQYQVVRLIRDNSTQNVYVFSDILYNVNQIPNDLITYAKLQNVSVEQRLLGRGQGSGSGDVQEITLGTGLSMSGTVLSGGRELLTATRTYYVRTDGNDSNTGLVDSAGGAFLTVQRAVDVASSLDNGGFDVTIQIKDGTFTGAVTLKSYLGSGRIIIQGNSGTPANVLISTTSVNCFTADGVVGIYRIKDLKVATTTSGDAFSVQNGSTVEFGNINFGATAGSHTYATNLSRLVAISNYSITGNAGFAHHNISRGALAFVTGVTVTLTGTPNFGGYYTFMSDVASSVFAGNTYSGAATGTRYQIDSNATCNTSGGGVNYFPGNAASGTPTLNGGQYL